MDKPRELALVGSILGVEFSVSLTEGEDESTVVSGIAGNQPVNLTMKHEKETISVSGELLGKEFSLSGSTV